MGLASKLITRIEQQAETIAGYRQLDDQRRARICVLEDALLAAKSERDKALADVQNWREEWQGTSAAGELMQAEIDSLREQLAAAQQPDVDAMRVFVDKVRACVWACYEWPQSWHKIEAALVELDDQPATVAETEGEK